MVRFLSGIVLLVVFVSAIWWLGPWPLLLVVEAVVVLATVEYASLMSRIGTPVPVLAAAIAAGAACAAVAVPGSAVEVVVMAVALALGSLAVGAGRVAPDVPVRVSAAAFPALYLGLPLGAFVALHGLAGREAVLLVFVTVAASDTAQLYSGRLFGRHLLAPALSPKKTVEGAIGGLVGGTAVLALVGHWWLPQVPPGWRVALGLVVVAFGMLGDLFESLLKRSAGVKDSSGLIPGHGGVLDRVDALLFAIPVYYIFLRYGLGAVR